MKKLVIIFLILLQASCQDEKKSSSSSELSERDTVSAENIPPGNIQEERDALQTPSDRETTERETANVEKPDPVTNFNGKYRKIVDDAPAADCNCNCIEVNFDAPTEWCIVKDKMYITARSQKSGENSADLYFVNVSRENNVERALPWTDFDTTTPIANIQFQPDGTAEVDWTGFTINGEVATEYAIFGKKTLEGTYKRE